MKEMRIKIVVDRMPQNPEECFYAHYLKSEDTNMNANS